jgi:hypothetical protein
MASSVVIADRLCPAYALRVGDCLAVSRGTLRVRALRERGDELVVYLVPIAGDNDLPAVGRVLLHRNRYVALVVSAIELIAMHGKLPLVIAKGV